MRPTAIFGLILLGSIASPSSVICNDFYPLDVGNKWFYRSVGLMPSDSTISTTVSVVGDTILSNGLQYYVLSQVDIMGSKYVRTDSVAVYYFLGGQDREVFKTNGWVGDSTYIGVGPFAYVRNSETSKLLVFGDSVRSITFVFGGLISATVVLCEKLGPRTEWQFSDPPPPWPDFGYELVGCRLNGVDYGRTLGVLRSDPVPSVAYLNQNFPNPFNPETNISFFLPIRQSVTLKIVDIAGKDIRTLVDELESQGLTTFTWDGKDNNGRQVSSGAYIYQLSFSNARLSKRMLLLR
jgi:hypothetical protein